MSESYLEIQLDKQPIELCKLLKIADLVSGGGEAKVVISEGYVLLNGDVEFQKRKKVYHNDIVEFNGEVIQVIINEELADSSIDDAINDNSTQLENNAASVEHRPKLLKQEENKKKAALSNESTANKRKRKPISF